MAKNRVRRLTVVALAPAIAAFAGCSSDRSQLQEIRWNTTPELHTATLSKTEADNLDYLHLDRGERDLIDDFRRVIHADNSSGLTPYPRMR